MRVGLFARRRRSRTRSRGQSLVEFALVVPAFLLLIMALFDLGRVVYAQHTITEDAREASRKGQVLPIAPITAFYSPEQYQAIRDAALGQSVGITLTNENITGRAGQACPVLDPVDSTSCFYPDGTGIGDKVEVNIRVEVPLLTPIVSQFVGGSLTLTARSVSYIQ